MSIILNVSHSLEPLVARLTDAFGSEKRNPFIPEWIVTQTEGMNIWIRQQLAYRLGIASNIRFCSPDDIVARVHYRIDRGNRKPLDGETIRWGIYVLLGETTFIEGFPEIANYYKDNDIKRISLADELADLYDQYQVYREDAILAWNAAWDAKAEAADWQAWIWSQLRMRFQDRHMDRVETAQLIISGLREEANRSLVRKTMPSLHVFGIAIITPFYLQIFRALSAFIDIHLYLVNPAPEKPWLDDLSERQISRLLQKNGKPNSTDQYTATGNELLLNWGRIIRESFQLLFSDANLINIYNPIPFGGQAMTGSLLQKIQTDIHENHAREERIPIGADDWKDGSITLNGCYTPLREVEVLYNHLVTLMNARKEKISPRNILVMVSDIDIYAPFIRAVFDHAPYRFPITIADQTITYENNMFTALQDLLSIDATQMKAEEVMELLESPYIKKRFGITDTDALRTAVRQAGIIYSMEGRQADDTRYVSWNYGLKKILFGLCMSGSEEYTDGSETIVPLDTDEGASALERVRLINFIRILHDRIEARKTPRTIAGWAAYLRELMEDMVFQAGIQEDEDHPRFINLIEQLSTLDEALPLEVDFDVFRHSFLHRLSLERTSQHFLGSGITFCSLVPMRSIPFSIVAMLGMDFDKFPRKDTRLSFSLITKEPRPGDRNVRNNDRHLFLETLLTAKESLYISYIARSEKNAEDMPPSSLVDELIDYTAQGMGADTDRLRAEWIRIHSLHGFGRMYFEPGGPPNYLSDDRYRTSIEIKLQAPRTAEKIPEILDIAQLGYFLEHPPKYYLNKRFNVYYREVDLLLPEHELFELGTIDEWQVRKDLLLIEEDALDRYADQKVKMGRIPLSNMGRATMRLMYEELDEMRIYVREAQDGNQPEALPIDFKVAGMRLTGQIENLYGGKLLEICYSVNHFKHLLSAWVRHLGVCAMGREAGFIFITYRVPGIHCLPAGTIGTAQAQEMLVQFVQYYLTGLEDYFPFYPNLAKNNFETLGTTYDSFKEQIESAIEDEYNFMFKDDYLKTAIKHRLFSKDNYPALVHNMHQIMDPINELLPQLFH